MSYKYNNHTVYSILVLMIYPTLSYFVPDGATAGTWEAAQTQCANSGSSLATLRNPGNQHWANDACGWYCDDQGITNAECRCWIGLKANYAFAPFTYDDDTLINTDSYGFEGDSNRPAVSGNHPWKSGNPNLNSNPNICVYGYHGNVFKWNDVDCSGGGVGAIYPLCNGDKTTGCYGNCRLCENKDECRSSRLICAYADIDVGGSGCVPQSDTPFLGIDIDMAGWLDAEDHCNELGGHLASINSELENQWATSICTSITTDNGQCNIGLRYFQGPTWEWTNGKPFDYGMPDDFGVYPSPPWGIGYPDVCERFGGDQYQLRNRERGRGCIGYLYHSGGGNVGWLNDVTDDVDSGANVFICRLDTAEPTQDPSETPSKYPSKHPSKYPSKQPSKQPSKYPSKQPSKYPTSNPVESKESKESE